MPGYRITMPDGKSYEVRGPEGYTQEQAYSDLQKQLGAQSGNTVGGDLLRGLAHGGTMGQIGNDPGPGASRSRQIGETLGDIGTSTATGVAMDIAAPESIPIRGLIGAGIGFAQPADTVGERLKNAMYGGGGAIVGQGLAKGISAARAPLNTLANEGIGATLGHLGLGPWGGYGGLWAGRGIGHQLQNVFGGRGLADLLAAAARNPGLAAYLGIKAAPGVEEAGKYVGEELGKPAQ